MSAGWSKRAISLTSHLFSPSHVTSPTILSSTRLFQSLSPVTGINPWVRWINVPVYVFFHFCCIVLSFLSVCWYQTSSPCHVQYPSNMHIAKKSFLFCVLVLKRDGHFQLFLQNIHSFLSNTTYSLNLMSSNCISILALFSCTILTWVFQHSASLFQVSVLPRPLCRLLSPACQGTKQEKSEEVNVKCQQQCILIREPQLNLTSLNSHKGEISL